MKRNLKTLVWFTGILVAFSAAAQGPGGNPALAKLTGVQIDALRQAVCLAEPRATVQSVFADLAVAPAGSSQQNMLKARLNNDNLSLFCLAGPLNREGTATGLEYGCPDLDQMTTSAMRTAEQGNVVGLENLEDVRWDVPQNGEAQGGFTFDTGTGYKGTCLFLARQNGPTWKIIRLVIQKTGSDKLEDGYPVFDLR